MNKKATIEISEAARLQAEERAQERGESLSDYVDSLIREDAGLDLGLDPAWIREKLEEGFASGNAGPLTDDVIQQLVAEGIARAKSRK